MQKLVGFQAGPLPELTPVLKKWIYANQEYVSRCEGLDAAWWYHERACLSTVAAATWLAGGIALEEYTTTKTQLPDMGTAKISERCRCDLFLSIQQKGRARKNHDFIVEAKMIWPNINSRNLHGQIESGIIKVRKDDVRRTSNDGYSRRLAMLFISPWISKAKLKEWDGHRNAFVETLQNWQGVAAAWVFTDQVKGLLSKRTGEYYPGTALLVTPLRGR